MRWKSVVVAAAIVLASAIGRADSLGTSVTEDSCWQAYFDQAVEAATDFESCLRSLSLFGSLGVEWCTLVYVEQAESALFRFIGCFFS